MILEKKYNYVYIITNIITNKQYVGEHSCDNLEKDNYYGSGIILKESIKKYNKSNFKKEILEFFSSKIEAHNSQEKYIIKYNTLYPNGYNISPTGGMFYGGFHSEETKEKLRMINIGKILSQETKEKIGIKSKNRSKESNYRCGSTNRGKETWMKGKHHTKESISKNRQKHLGKKDSEETKLKKSIASKGENNPMYKKSFYDIWIQKYGKEEADIKYNRWKENVSNGSRNKYKK